MLEAAASAFAENGYQATTIEDVAAAAGFSKGAVYSNFAGKQQLFLALVRQRVQDRLAAVTEVADDAETADEEAERAGHALAELLRRDPGWHRLFLEFWAQAAADPELQPELAEHRREMRRLIASLIEQQAERHDLKLPVPSGQLAVIVLALSNGIAIEHLADPATVSPDLIATALRLMLGPTSPPATRRGRLSHPARRS